MPKTKLTIPEQIQDMTNKGITFKYNDNDSVIEFLKHNSFLT